MILFVGLGNIGDIYKKTVHNIGFDFIDHLKKTNALNIESELNKFKSDLTKIKISQHKVILAKPKTFMNNSGDAVSLIKKFYKIDNKNIYVFYDDIWIPTGKIKIKNSQGANGHNGIKSIEKQIGFDFNRVKIGIKKENNNIDIKYYVLSKISEDNYIKINQLISLMASYIDVLLSDKKNSNSVFIDKVYKSFS